MPELFGTTDPKTGESRPLGIVNIANEKAYKALDLLVKDLAKVFASSPYIQIGTDECGAGGLVKLPEYIPYCEKHGLKKALEGHAHELFLHFIDRMNTIVRKHGKQAIAWNDFGGARTPNVTIPKNLVAMVWTGSPVTMVERGYPIINRCWLPLLRPRAPAFAERLWHEKAGRTFKDFKQRRNHTDKVVQKIILPVTFEINGLIDEKNVCFEKDLTIKMSSSFPGTIRYTIKKEWEHFPDAESPAYAGPITLDGTMTISARLYNADGSPIGGVTQQRFRKIVPAYKYRLLDHRGFDWREMPDFETLGVLREGVTGLMDRDRSDQINRARFARIQPVGHVDVCVHNVYNRRITELTSQIMFPEDGKYAFKMKMGHGMSELHIGGKLVLSVRGKGREFQAVGKVKAETYPVMIKHFFNGSYNDLNIMVKKPESKAFMPYEEMILPISDWVDKTKLSRSPQRPDLLIL